MTDDRGALRALLQKFCDDYEAWQDNDTHGYSHLTDLVSAFQIAALGLLSRHAEPAPLEADYRLVAFKGCAVRIQWIERDGRVYSETVHSAPICPPREAEGSAPVQS
jgi:hypothetical protein